MSQTLSDFSQLKRSMFKEEPEKVKPEPVLKTSEVSAELAYFTKRLPGGLTQTPESASSRDAERIAALEQALAAKTAVLAEVTAAKEALGREVAAAQTALAQSQAEVTRLKAQCAQLQRDLQACADAVSAAPAEPEPAPPESSPVPAAAPAALLAAVSVEEVFPGELREMTLDALKEACAAAEQAGRQRRAALLARLLAGNRASGELDRRCAGLRQILKNAGSFTDGKMLKELEKLGFRLVSGRNHWKLEYGEVRQPLSKTPSDFRSNRNAVSEIINKCF